MSNLTSVSASSPDSNSVRSDNLVEFVTDCIETTGPNAGRAIVLLLSPDEAAYWQSKRQLLAEPPPPY